MTVDANRRYLQRSFLVAVVFVATLFVAKQLIKGEGVSGFFAYALALVPGLVMAGFFWSTGKLIVETRDEYLRMLIVRQQLIATGFTMSVAAIWGTLELLELVPKVEIFYLIIVWSVGTVVGQLANVMAHGIGRESA
jgi:hypothetical protein